MENGKWKIKESLTFSTFRFPFSNLKGVESERLLNCLRERQIEVFALNAKNIELNLFK